MIRVIKARVIPLVILASLLVILTGKVITASQNSYTPLYIYGILVTSVILTTFLVALLRYQDPALARGKPQKSARKPLVSCMVAVRNEQKLIENCLNSLLDQTYPAIEIIIVNDASTDDTKSVLESYAREGRITAIHLKTNVGKKRALGKAMWRAKGEIFAFTDSDSVLAPDAIARVVDAFNNDPMIGAVSGHCRALNAETNLVTRMQDTWYEGQFAIRKAFESVFGSVTCVSGPLAVFRKEAIFNFVPAWENDSFLGQEFKFATDRTLTGFVLGCQAIGEQLKDRYRDSRFVARIDYPVRDWKVVYCKSARALTAVPDTFAKMLRQQVRWKKSFIRNMFFTGRFYWRKPLIPALVYYLRILFVWVGPIIAFRHLVYLPIQGDINAAFLYLGGIGFIGMIFGLAFKLDDRSSSKWIYRPLMGLMSTLIFSWLVFYSAATIKKMVWYRG